MDPLPVRPGTSDALFARTIDATIHPPLVRAQETVVALVPRVAEAAAPLASPLFLGALALTILFTWVAIRMRYRPSAIVLGVLLVMTLTSFHPVPKPEQSRIAQVRTPRTRIGGLRPAYQAPPAYNPPPEIDPPDIATPIDPVQVILPPDFVERIPDWSREAMQSAEQMMRDNERVREIMQQIRYRLREEARRQRDEARRRHWRQMMAERDARSREFGLIETP